MFCTRKTGQWNVIGEAFLGLQFSHASAQIFSSVSTHCMYVSKKRTSCPPSFDHASLDEVGSLLVPSTCVLACLIVRPSL
jgi:hypothetical protein